MTGQAQPGPGHPVLGGGVMGADDYAVFLGREYLTDYVPSGGGSVKVSVIGHAEVADRFARKLSSVAGDHDCLFASVSAETVKVHLVDQLFFAVSRQVDWEQLAAAVVRSAYDAIAVPAPGSLAVTGVAAAHDLDAPELYRSVRRQLEHTLLADGTLPRDMRRAFLRLAQVHLGTGDTHAAEAQVVLDWLHGERVGLRELREARIYTRIGRHNGRAMLSSLGRLLLRAGRGGAGPYASREEGREAERPRHNGEDRARAPHAEQHPGHRGPTEHAHALDPARRGVGRR